MSETRYGFTRFDTIDEFKKWLNNKSVSRSVYRLQVHHTYLPSYAQWKEDELVRQRNMKYFHMNTNGWGDIAQHFTIFPNGKIVTGRNLNSTPIGIKGWNTGAICIEIYGDFDKGRDKMYKAQKEAVIACYALLCKKFKITPSENTIRCHGWFTAGGTYLGGYVRYKSAKTCPGTNFMGIGNTKSAFIKGFYPLIKEYMAKGSISDEEDPEYSTGLYRVIVDKLNIRKGGGTSFDIVGAITDKGSYTISKVDGNWGYLKSGVGWINISSKYCEKVKNVEDDNKEENKDTPSETNQIYRVIVDSLNIRKGPGTSFDIVGKITDKGSYTISKIDGNWGYLKSGVGWISISSKYCQKVS